MSRGVMQKVGSTGVYVSKPETPSTKGILLIHEWWGLNEHIKGLADALALRGYNAVAVDLFDGRTTAAEKEASELMGADDRAKSLPKLRAALEWMRTGALKAEKVATIGWCFGGGYSLQCALQFSDLVNASVIFYGMVETDEAKLRGCKVPLLGVFAEQDNWITLPKVMKFEEACKRAGVPLENHIYDAHHAFANPRNAFFDPELARDAESKVLAFLREELG